MGCIEMDKEGKAVLPAVGLIETWDVLKSGKNACVTIMSTRLIETWDVLKCQWVFREPDE